MSTQEIAGSKNREAESKKQKASNKKKLAESNKKKTEPDGNKPYGENRKLKAANNHSDNAKFLKTTGLLGKLPSSMCVPLKLTTLGLGLEMLQSRAVFHG